MRKQWEKNYKENKNFGRGVDVYMTVEQKEKWKQKLSEILTGIPKTITKKTRQKISLSIKGKIKVNNGKKNTYADPNTIPKGYKLGWIKKNK